MDLNMPCRFIPLALSFSLQTIYYYSCNNIRSVFVVGGFPRLNCFCFFWFIFAVKKCCVGHLSYYCYLPSARARRMHVQMIDEEEEEEENSNQNGAIRSCKSLQHRIEQIFVRNLHRSVETAMASQPRWQNQTKLTAKRLIKRNELLFSFKLVYFIVLTFFVSFRVCVFG